MLDLLIHSDWSTDPRKRWMVVAERRDGRWEVNAPEPVPQDAELIEHSLFGKRRVLAGFDFPIGVPVVFGKQTGLNGFVEALSLFGFGAWSSGRPARSFGRLAAIKSARPPFMAGST
jgi:hypothetical protein